MKILALSLVCLFLSICASAQTNSDSLAYQLQRKKINSMLAQRTQKFGQYDESLSMHTGIFGFQTKKDIRRSNDILMDIVRTDDNIYKELKILLDYRAFQQTQAQTQSNEVEKNRISFMTTINKLRDQVDQADQNAAKLQKANDHLRLLFVVTTAVLAIMVLFFASRKRSIKR